MAAETADGRDGFISEPRRRQLADLFKRYRANTKAVLGSAIVAALVLTAAFGPVFVSREAAIQITVTERFLAPSLAHPMGTDNLGRDMFMRVILGAQTSLYIGVLSVGIALALGVPLGAIAGYDTGYLDDAIMRVMDILMSYPPLVFALMITAVIGGSLTNALIALGIVYTPSFARVTRSEVVSVVEEDFVEAAKAIGERDSYIVFSEVLPNALAPVIVQATITMAYAILTAAGLSFLGLGVQPPTPAWGLMISGARQYLVQAPWMAVFPGIAIAITVLGFNLFGDGLRDVLDPTLKNDR
ncbi:ABC transporter permease [Halolamina litorea]|nr:ABC transporter permease [Halolamina litorea]